MTEDGLQIVVATWLRNNVCSSVLWWHTPNGGLRNRAVAAKLKAMGTRPGIPDLMFEWPGGRLAIELKSDKGRASPDQLEVGRMLEANGCPWRVARTLVEVKQLLGECGVPLLASHQQAD